MNHHARRLAIGDIHGCAGALAALLKAVQPTADDLLVTLGDYVDRGPASKTVIDLLLDLSTACDHVALRGNHELMMLDALSSESWRSTWLGAGGKATLESYGGAFEDIPSAHIEFLTDGLQPYYETDSHFFVHANVQPDKPLDEQSDAARYWQKFRDPEPHVSGKTMVCGHTPQASGLPIRNDHAISIDTKVYAEDGWLTCLEIETGKIWQANEAGETREGAI